MDELTRRIPNIYLNAANADAAMPIAKSTLSAPISIRVVARVRAERFALRSSARVRRPMADARVQQYPHRTHRTISALSPGSLMMSSLMVCSEPAALQVGQNSSVKNSRDQEAWAVMLGGGTG